MAICHLWRKLRGGGRNGLTGALSASRYKKEERNIAVNNVTLN